MGNQGPELLWGSGGCPGHCLCWARSPGAPSFGKSKFHIIFFPSGEKWGPPPCKAPQGQTPHGTRGGFQRKDWAKALFSADEHWTEAALVKGTRISGPQNPNQGNCQALPWENLSWNSLPRLKKRKFLGFPRPETAPCCCLLGFRRIFPHQLLPKAVCAATYWCTSIKLAAAT